MLKTGMKVKVYDGDFIGWTNGVLIDSISRSFNKWMIRTEDGTVLNRFVKEDYKEIIEDGCGYIIKS